MKVCFFSKDEDTFTTNSEEKLSITRDETYMNHYPAVARALGILLNYEISPEEWNSISYLYENKFNNILRHVVMCSFLHEDTIYVPTRNLNFTHRLAYPEELESTLESTLSASPEVVLDSFPLFKSFEVHSPDYISILLQDYNPFLGINELFYCGLFKLQRSMEKWNSYYMPLGDYPDIDNMPNLKGIVISGASYNMTDTHPFIEELESLIRKAYSKQIKVVGICLGHQAIASALGGIVRSNPDQGFIYKLEECTSNKENFIGDFRIPEIHEQCVLQVPEGLEVLHSSPSCQVESMYKKGSVLSFQGHPEMNLEFLRSFYSGLLLKEQDINQSEYDSVQQQFQNDIPDMENVIMKINLFLRDNDL